ncbi:MAG: hypothetical protein EUB_01580 [Eubacterium sp.]|uniref:hypothetical protein n=1 Tax=Eubacterium sp. TaxID=142586 RepID=UPI00303E618C
MNLKNKITPNIRFCRVGKRIGVFHTWEQYSDLFEASPLIGGAPAGCIAHVLGIVEFSTGVERVEPYRIKFEDDLNNYLCSYQKRIDDEEKLK